MRSAASFRLKHWMIAGATIAVVAVVVLVARPELVGLSGTKGAEFSDANSGSSTLVDMSAVDKSGRNSGAGATGTEGGSPTAETERAAGEAGPDGYRSLLHQLIASGLMAEYGPEFTQLLGGEKLRVATDCDLETFLGQLRAAGTPEEIRAALMPLAQALREAIKNKDPEATDIQRQLGVALLFAAEQVADSKTLTPEQQLDRMVRIGGVLGGAHLPELSLAMGDVATGFTSVPDTATNRRNIDAVLRGRLDASALVQDLQVFDGAAQRWIEASKDQRDTSAGSRYRLYAQRLATFPSERINSQGGATWPGLSELPANAIINIGTNWMKVPGGADKSGYIAARDGLVRQIDEIIRVRGMQVSKVEDVKRLQGFRNKLAAMRIR